MECLQDAALHYGWAVPAAGNTPRGEKAIPQPYHEVSRLVGEGRSGLIEK
jgi:hypothetical protein